MRCKINNSTRFTMINRLYTQHKYNHYSHPVHLHTHTHIPYRQQTASEPFVELCFEADKWIARLYLVGIVFHRDAPENEKLFLKRSVLGLGRVMNLDVARMLEQIKSCLRYGGARFLYALNTSTALLNTSFSLSGSSPKYSSFVSLVRENQISSILQLFCEEN